MKYKNDIDVTIPFIALILILVLAFSSCVTTGYGCNGRSKIMRRLPPQYRKSLTSKKKV
jgi:hypothetical protein